MNLAKSHRVAVPGHSVCWLDILRERYCHKSIDNFIKEAKTGVSPSFVQGIDLPPSWLSMAVTLDILSKLLTVQRAARL